MTTTISANDLRKLRLSLKWAWVGPAGGIACMIVLFIAGIVTEAPGLTVMATSVAAALGGVWAGVTASLRRKITQAEQR